MTIGAALALVLACCLASACSKEPTLDELRANTDAAESRYQQSAAKVADIDSSIAWLQEHHAEDPAKMNRLIDRCQRQTGQPMEGPGAAAITDCVKDAW